MVEPYELAKFAFNQKNGKSDFPKIKLINQDKSL